MVELTSITIKAETKRRLSKFAEFGESWDTFINRLCEKLEKEKEEAK